MDEQQISAVPIENKINNPEPGLTKKQQAGIYVLIFTIIIVLGVWYFMVRQYVTVNMYGSLNPATLKEEQLNAQKLAENQARLDDVYNTDTDGDEVADWEELNIYGTSPYLVDTDGDGFNDKQEIESKTNPNCPEGKECIGSMTTDQVPVDNSRTATSTVPDVGQDQLQLLKQAFGDNPDTNYLRTQLLSAATTDEQKAAVNGLTDAQLVEFYRQMVQGSSSAVTTNTATTTK